MPTLLLGVWGYVAAAVIAAAASGWAVHAIDNGAYQSLKAQNATQIATANAAALAQVETWAKQMHDAADVYSNGQLMLNDQIATIQRDLHNVQIHKPLIAGCAPDADRLHSLNAAIAASNAATAGH